MKSEIVTKEMMVFTFNFKFYFKFDKNIVSHFKMKVTEAVVRATLRLSCLPFWWISAPRSILRLKFRSLD